MSTVLTDERVQELREEAQQTRSSLAQLLHRELRGLPYDERVKEVHDILRGERPQIAVPPPILLEAGAVITPEFEVAPSRPLSKGEVLERRRAAVREGKDYGFYSYEKVPITPDITLLQRLARRTGGQYTDYAREIADAIARMRRRRTRLAKTKPQDEDAAKAKERELAAIPRFIDTLKEFKRVADKKLKYIDKGRIFTRGSETTYIPLQVKDAKGTPVKAKRQIIHTNAGDVIFVSAKVVRKDETTKAGVKVVRIERTIPIQINNAYKFLLGKHKECIADKTWVNKLAKATKYRPKDVQIPRTTDKFRWLAFAMGGGGLDRLTAQATLEGGRGAGGVYSRNAIFESRKDLLQTGVYKSRASVTPLAGHQLVVPQPAYDLLCDEDLCHADERFYQNEEYLWGTRAQKVYDELERMTPADARSSLPTLGQMKMWLKDNLDTVVTCQGIANVIKSEAKGTKKFAKIPRWKRERLIRDLPPEFGRFIDKTFVGKLGEERVGKPFTRKRKGKMVAIQKMSEIFFGRVPENYVPPEPRKHGLPIKVGKKTYKGDRAVIEFTEQPLVVDPKRKRRLKKEYYERLRLRRPAPLTDVPPEEFWQLMPTEEWETTEALMPRWRRGRVGVGKPRGKGGITGFRSTAFVTYPPHFEKRLGAVGRLKLKEVIEEQQADFKKSVRLAVQRAKSPQEFVERLSDIYERFVKPQYRRDMPLSDFLQKVGKQYKFPEEYHKQVEIEAVPYAKRIAKLTRKYQPRIKSKRHPKIKVPPPK